MIVCSDTDHCEERRDAGHAGTGEPIKEAAE
jgi:alpha-D-ribose 1-methylphosphonate 5-phosphate C-P lyase